MDDSEKLSDNAVRAIVLLSQRNRGSGTINVGLRDWYRNSQRARDVAERNSAASALAKAAAADKAKARRRR